MRRNTSSFIAGAWISCLVGAMSALIFAFGCAQETHSNVTRPVDGRMMIDGKPTQIIAGEMHYIRVPHAYWHDRLMKAKAMGLNTITTYVFWNAHEPKPGVFDFSGDKDLAEFIREAQEVGLYVILRPGPYVCAEWEFGGLPSWLLKDHQIMVRTNDPRFMKPVAAWMKRLGQEIAPLLRSRGGPIIAVQVENEYGSFGTDAAYLRAIHNILIASGITSSFVFTSNPPDDIKNGSLPDLPTVVNFGPGEAEEAFTKLHEFRPSGISMSGEYWAGWFDEWGKHHHVSNVALEAKDLDWMLRQGFSVNIYMFHGGTNFGWMNGANSEGKNYFPYVTSYDYGAALDEGGRPTEKYAAFKKVIESATGESSAIPVLTPTSMTISPVAFTESASLWDNLPTPIVSKNIQTMEDLDQAYGYILYRTTLHGDVTGDLVFKDLHDFAQVFVDGHLIGSVDRRLDQNHIQLDVKSASGRLDILVENSGRANYSQAIFNERKGITEKVMLAGRELNNWQIYNLPMDDRSHLHFKNSSCTGACFYRATFDLDSTADTFLDTRELGKGQVWINSRALGRFWQIGPQHALYLPAPWLLEGRNTVEVFDLNGTAGEKVQGVRDPLLR